MQLLKILLGFFFILVITILTQIGGLVFIISLLTHNPINKKVINAWSRFAIKSLSFLSLYLIFVFALVPLAAEPLGRVALPLYVTNHLRPTTIWTCLLNRNYVRPELREIAFKVSESMNKKYPGTIINYLDANFPFIDKFPLLPHLSHNDGEKLDLSFLYIDNGSGKQTDKVPSFIGYGISEEPKLNEENTPAYCSKIGQWQYSLLSKLISQNNKVNYKFDEQRTKYLVNNFVSDERLGRIFIEPHLKVRLGLTSEKIKFHGCHAVRHDDHLHVQLK